MYMLANTANPALPKPSSWRQRRPELTLAKSSLWSYSANGLDRAYPSPPMSNSPTFPRRLSQSTDERSSENAHAPVTSAPGGQHPQSTLGTGMEGPMLSMPGPASHLPQRYGQKPPGMYQEHRHELQPRPIASNPQYGQQYHGYAPVPRAVPTPLGVQAHRDLMPAGTYQGPISTAGSANPRMARTSRRAKAHVARACQNCKKAHLSCDEARPCARCVGSGKQATCVDVEHKKRGRPRLRDDREQRLEQQAAAAIAAQSTSQSQPQPPASKDIGPGRGHKRADSLRVLRSQTQTSTSPNPMTLPAPDQRSFGGIAAPSSGYSSYYAPQPEPPRGSGPPITAFLNMNLEILRASDSFRTLLADGRDVRGRAFSEFIAPVQAPGLQRLQSDLRDERSRREPTFLPGIFPDEQEQNAVQNHDVEDVETLSQGYDDHRREAYTFLLPNGRTEQIQIRVRLARTSTFFATVVLYRAAPQQAPSATSAFSRRQSLDPYSSLPPQPSPTHSSFGQYLGPQSPYTASAPGSPFSTLPQALMTTLPPTSSSISVSHSTAASALRTDQGYFTRAPPTMTGMYPPPPPPLSRPHSSGSHSGAAHERRRQGPDSSQGSIQLPPIERSGPPTPITSQFFEQQQQQQQQHAGSGGRRTSTERTAEESEEDNRKRRRLNIKEIIEK